MIGLDTNVLVRYFAQDDQRQSKAARNCIETTLTPGTPGYVGAISLAEFSWVLKRLYRATREEIAEAVEALLAAPVIVVEHRQAVWQAIADFRRSATDFNDCLIGRINELEGCEFTLTFDRAAAKLPGFRLLA